MGRYLHGIIVFVFMVTVMHGAEAAVQPKDGTTNAEGQIYDTRVDSWVEASDYYGRRGYVSYLNSWIPKTRYQKIQSRLKKVRAYLESKSSWDSAWEGRSPSGDFKITTNTSHQVANEMAYGVDLCARELKRIIGLRKFPLPVPLEIYATQEQFITGSLEGDPAIPVSRGVLGYFWWWGSRRGIRMFYAGSLDASMSTLFHEATHLILRDYCVGHIPTWCNEGLAVFFEDIRRTPDGKKLDLKAIPFTRLWHLHRQLEEGDIDLNHLVTRNGMEQYSVKFYPQGWGLIHFLLFYDDGKYRKRLAAMYTKMKKRAPKPSEHIQHFKESFGVEPNDLYPEWKEYILNIEPEDLTDQIGAAYAAFTSNFLNWEKAIKYATMAYETDKKDPEVQLMVGRLHLQAARWLAGHDEQVDLAQRALPFFENWSTSKNAKISKRTKGNLLEKTLAWNDYALAHVYARQYDKAFSVIESILDVDMFSGDSYRTLALLHAIASDPNLKNIDAAKHFMGLADDMGSGPRNLHAQALIASAEGNHSQLNELLDEAHSQDWVGFGAHYYPREKERLKHAEQKGRIPGSLQPLIHIDPLGERLFD